MDQSPSKPPKKWRFRIAVALVLCLPWLVAGFLGAEFLERIRENKRGEEAEAHWAARQPEIARQEEAVIAQVPDAAPRAASDFEARAGFQRLDEAARQEFVNRRGEAVIVLDGAGMVESRYLPDLPGAVHDFAEGTTIGAPFADLLTAETRGDFEGAVAQARGNAGTPLRDYPVLLPDGSGDVLQFALTSPGNERVAVFTRLSMWDELWVSFRPGVSQNDAYQFETNALGWRDDPVVLPKPPGLYRIVCVGGSTVAEGRTNALTYPNLLEGKLKDRFGANRVEVINAGVFASTASLERDRLEQYLELQPDLVIHYNLVNDITNLLPQMLEQPGMVNTVKGVLRRSHLVYNHLNRWLLPSDKALRAFLEEQVLLPLEQLGEGVEKSGARMAFATFAAPDYANLPMAERDFFDKRINSMGWGRTISMGSYQHIVDLYNQRLASFCAENGFLFLPVAEKIQGDLGIFTDICHMTQAGIDQKAQIFADELAPEIEASITATDAADGSA